MMQSTESNINTYIDKVTNLKNKIIEKHKSDADKSNIVDLLKEMRLYHGRAIYENEVEKIAMLKGLDINMLRRNNITDDEFIKLSINDSILHVIHNNIRISEKKLYGQNIMSSDSDDKKNIFDKVKDFFHFDKRQTGGNNENNNNNNTNNALVGEKQVSAAIHQNVDKTDELSIKGLQTETEPGPGPHMTETYPDFNAGLKNSNKTISMHNVNAQNANLQNANLQNSNRIKPVNSRNVNTDNLTDYVNNLTSSEARHLASEYNENSIQQSAENPQPDVTKPTLINYWADSCGFSTKFDPHWKNFKKIASQKFPHLQITELNVKHDTSLNDLAKKVGVEGYPTLVYFKAGKKYFKQAGNSTSADVEKFISDMDQQK